MSILSGITQFITGTPKTTEKVIDGIVSGVDKVWYTDEEKADGRQKTAELWLELQKTLAQESMPRSVNRRIFAWGIILMCFLLTLLGIGFGAYDHEAGYNSVIAMADKFKWGWALSAAVVFYFGPHLADKLKSK